MNRAIIKLLSICPVVYGLGRSEALQNLIYPWPDRPAWPSLKMSYNYQLMGYLRGTEIVKDGTYSYSRSKGYNEAKIEQKFEYYTLVKVDSNKQRALQTLWVDSFRE